MNEHWEVKPLAPGTFVCREIADDDHEGFAWTLVRYRDRLRAEQAAWVRVCGRWVLERQS